jgi:thiol-disulfide isomerase/thioredoxin
MMVTPNDSEATLAALLESALPADNAPTPTAVAAASTWQTLPLVNARTGESFTLADFSGKTVFIEPMATWCTNCRNQLTNLRDATTQVNNPENVVYIALSVETNISAADLAAYADAQGFDYTFAVMTPDMLRAMTDAFGRIISVPPATPHLIIRPDGTHTSLLYGQILSTAQLVELINTESDLS